MRVTHKGRPRGVTGLRCSLNSPSQGTNKREGNLSKVQYTLARDNEEITDEHENKNVAKQVEVARANDAR